MLDGGVAIWAPASGTQVGGRRRIALLVGAFVLTRAACLAAIALSAAWQDHSPSDAVSRFDGTWYAQIARHGYPDLLPRGPHGIGANPTAFFPLFPSIVSGLMHMGLAFPPAALVVATTCGAVACVLIDAVVRGYADARVALGSALLWTAQPFAFVLSLTYAESLYTMLAAACLLALLHERWWLAGAASALATATRPSAVLLVPVVVLAVLLAARRRGRVDLAGGAAVLLAPLGVVSYVAYLGVHTGRADAWWRTEHDGWQVYLDGGRANVQRIAHYLAHPAERPAAIAVAVTIAVLVVLAVLLLRDRPPAVIAAFAVLSLLLALLTRNAYSSIPRFALPAFPLLVPLVRRWPRYPSWLGVTALAASTIVMAELGAYVAVWSSYPP